LTFPINTGSGASTAYSHDLNGGSFCLKRAEWRYSVPGGQLDDYGWPKVPMQISINGAMQDQTASPVVISPPALLKNKVEVSISNPSSLQVTIHLTITGTLVTPIGDSALTSKEMLGYSLLDDSQKGMLALEEAATDRMREHLKQLGFDSQTQEQIMLGQSNTSNINPSALPSAVIKALDTESNNTKKPEELKSLLVGDLVQFKLTNSSEITLDEIQALSDYLLSKEWKK